MSKHKYHKPQRRHGAPSQNARPAPYLQPAPPPAAIHPPHHADKLSQAVIAIATPVLDRTPDVGEKEMILVVATQIWNIGLLPRAEQGKVIHDIVEALGLHEAAPEILDSFLKDIDMMLEQKRKYYAGDRRAILDYEIEHKHGMLNLRVLGLDELEAA